MSLGNSEELHESTPLFPALRQGLTGIREVYWEMPTLWCPWCIITFCVCVGLFRYFSLYLFILCPPPPPLSQADKYFVNYEMIHIESFEQNPGRFWFEV